jgi:cytochrome c biogenesis protein CcmG, thiol:disulfide interchange protein DsbE
MASSTDGPDGDPDGSADPPPRSRWRWILLVVACAALPAALLVAAGRDTGSHGATATGLSSAVDHVDLSHLPRPGDRAPGFTLRTLTGRRVSLAQYAGRPVVLTFFASWCNPCEKETPVLQAAVREHRAERLAVLGVMFRDRTEDARSFLRRLGATYPAADDPDGSVARAYGVVNIPVTFFIAPDGTIVTRGFGLTRSTFPPMLDQLLAHPRT